MNEQKENKEKDKKLYKALASHDFGRVAKAVFPEGGIDRNYKEKDPDGLKAVIRESIISEVVGRGLDTHYLSGTTVSKLYRPLTLNFAIQLAKEYDCKRSDEKALVEVAVSAFGRIIEHSQSLWQSQKVQWFSAIGRELDRANKQFISALTMLNKIKKSSLK